MSKKLEFFGSVDEHGDSIFVVRGLYEDDITFNHNEHEDSEGDIVLAVEAYEGVMHVVAHHNHHESAGWLIGVVNALDEDLIPQDIPDWSIAVGLTNGSREFKLTIVAPDDVDVRVAD